MFTIPSATANSLLSRENPKTTLFCAPDTKNTDNLVLKSTLSLWDRLDMFWNTKEGDIPKWIPVTAFIEQGKRGRKVEFGFLNYGKLSNDYGLDRDATKRRTLENQLIDSINHTYPQTTTDTIVKFLNNNSALLVK